MTPIVCVKCNTQLPLPAQPMEVETKCERCGREFRVITFPVHFIKEQAVKSDAKVHDEHTSSCFYHETREASSTCDHCGRFICSLCEFNIGQHVYCPQCLKLQKESGNDVTLEAERLCMDRVVLNLSILSIFLWPVIFYTAPLALYWGFKYWNKPGSLLASRRRIRMNFIIGMSIAFLEVAGIITGIGFIIYKVIHL